MDMCNIIDSNRRICRTVASVKSSYKTKFVEILKSYKIANHNFCMKIDNVQIFTLTNVKNYCPMQKFSKLIFLKKKIYNLTRLKLTTTNNTRNPTILMSRYFSATYFMDDDNDST